VENKIKQNAQILSREHLYPQCKMKLANRTLLKGLTLGANSNSKIEWWLKQFFLHNWAISAERFGLVRTGSARSTEF
jgi:hypothetical protein